MSKGFRFVLLAVLAAHPAMPCRAAAQEAKMTEREVVFRNGAVELQGTLILPANRLRAPAVVFLHGSGPATRSGARAYADEFAKLGIAGLIFDKRGSGKSGGSWTTASLEDLANDALAAVAFARSQPEIDSSRVGFWGVSQAGWVATLAASKSKNIAFMVLISGGGATPLESERFAYQTSFDKAGLPASEKADANRVIDSYFQYLATGNGRQELVARLDSAKTARWYQFASLDQILPSQENVGNWRWVATWDPASATETIHVPVLLMFGDRDTDHPTEIAVRKWREGLKKAGNDSATVMIFPGAGHGIRMREGYTGKGRPPFADGYGEAMLGWMWMHVAHEER